MEEHINYNSNDYFSNDKITLDKTMLNAINNKPKIKIRNFDCLFPYEMRVNKSRDNNFILYNDENNNNTGNKNERNKRKIIRNNELICPTYKDEEFSKFRNNYQDKKSFLKVSREYIIYEFYFNNKNFSGINSHETKHNKNVNLIKIIEANHKKFYNLKIVHKYNFQIISKKEDTNHLSLKTKFYKLLTNK